MTPAVFVRAARRIAEHEEPYCCWVLDGDCAWDESDFFKDTFRPDEDADHWPHGYWGCDTKSELARTLALLLCAEMCKEMK